MNRITRQTGMIMVLVVISATSHQAQAQRDNTRPGGLTPILPVVPQQNARTQEGNTADRQFQTDAGEAPVASFVESLKGNDSAFQVIVGQGRLLTLKQPIAEGENVAVIAVGDPTIVDFDVLPNPRMIRVLGKRAGVTDLSITTNDGQAVSFEVHVGYDLELLRAQLKQIFPTALIKLAQLREHIVVEGQARSSSQVAQIVETVEAYLQTAQPGALSSGQFGADNLDTPRELLPPTVDTGPEGAVQLDSPRTIDEQGFRPESSGAVAEPRVINLLRVPGVHQVMLQVKIAELNRTGLREIGADLGIVSPGSGNLLGTSIDGSIVQAISALTTGGLTGSAAFARGTNTTAFGIFPSSDFNVFLRILRENSLLTILAEPNLVAMSGHEASFLAGGQFAVPVPQNNGINSTVTVQFKDFGVQLDFLPFVMDDDVLRLSVVPEVSSIDFSLGTTLVVGGDPVPGLNTRRAATTVEMREGQTLAIAGLLQVTLDAQTSRIPGLGDLPYLGPLFSNTSHRRVEKELLVLVTPQLVSATDGDIPIPGCELADPTDWEFYLNNRIEGRSYHSPPTLPPTTVDVSTSRFLEFEQNNVSGPVGFSEGVVSSAPAFVPN